MYQDMVFRTITLKVLIYKRNKYFLNPRIDVMIQACRSCRDRVGWEITLLCSVSPVSRTIYMLGASLVKENLIGKATSLCCLLTLDHTVWSKLQQTLSHFLPMFPPLDWYFYEGIICSARNPKKKIKIMIQGYCFLVTSGSNLFLILNSVCWFLVHPHPVCWLT